jgi:peptidoglycan/LPS O-acetylase OafA/YrhL
MSEELSAKIEALRGLAVVLVVIVHAPGAHFNFGGVESRLGDVPFLGVQQILSGGLAKAGVALFAFISGFLFFHNVPDSGAKAWFLDKGRRRLRSLLVPYLAWSGLGLIGYWVLGQFPLTEPFVTRYSAEFNDPGQIAFRLFCLPVAYPLWFVRDLMLSALLSPALYLCIRRFGPGLPAVLLGYWLLNPAPANPALPLGDLRCLTFFSLGAWVSIRSVAAPGWLRDLGPVLLAGWAISAVLSWLFYSWDLSSVFQVRLTVLLGFAALWLGYDAVAGRATVLRCIGGVSFFVYAAHEPLLTATRKFVFWAVGYNATAVHLTYFLTPVLVVSGLYVLARVLQKYVPRIYGFLTGRRLAGDGQRARLSAPRAVRSAGAGSVPCSLSAGSSQIP